jgi:hypothetical protein
MNIFDLQYSFTVSTDYVWSTYNCHQLIYTVK